MAYRWTLRPADEAAAARLAADLNDLPPALARALVLRGIPDLDTARRFFRDGLSVEHDPFLMADMDRAADRLAEAITRGERVLVYGDYDVDGVTSTAMMTDFLRREGVETTFFIPHRFEHGYGLNAAGMDAAVARGASLVVALDCGITGHAEALYARDLGLDLVIADHHQPGDTLPEATAVLDPMRADCAYPFKGLSGCGVGYKLIRATLARLGRDPNEAHAYLDLLAISTAADIVSVSGENRVLMREGLARLATTPRLGLHALARLAGKDLASVTTSDIVFGLGPRINAAGRMGSAEPAAELLLADDPAEAQRLADLLEAANAQRRTRNQLMQAEAFQEAEAFTRDSVPMALVLHRPTWHGGLLGIVAARIAETYSRPTVLLAGQGPLLRGSARSVGGVSIYDALAACGPVLDHFGGHHAAAGVGVSLDQLDTFRAALDEAVAAVASPDDLVPELALDADLPLAQLDGGLNSRFWAILRQFEPFGPDNPKPVFRATDVAVREARRIGKDRTHLKLSVESVAGSDAYSVIGFGLGEHAEALEAAGRAGRPVELAFQIEENHFRNTVSLQLDAKDVRIS